MKLHLLFILMIVLLTGCGNSEYTGSSASGGSTQQLLETFTVSLVSVSIQRLSNHAMVDVNTAGVNSRLITLVQ